MLPSQPVLAARYGRLVRLLAIAALLAVIVFHPFAGRATGEQSVSDLREQLSEIQNELDAVTERVEAARAERETVAARLAVARKDLDERVEENNELRAQAEEHATALYMEGGMGMFEVLLSADDFGDLSDHAEILSRVSMGNTDVFVRLARSEKTLADLRSSLNADRARLLEIEGELQAQAEELESKLNSVSGRYEELMKELGYTGPVAIPQARGGMFCPVAGPTSFTDTWGAPRSGGRSHQGVDMMGARGTPQVAVTSGTITYAGYSSLGGNVQYLSGDDGTLYAYVHSQSFAVTSGRVKAGQVISHLGDTGNARGIPHLHFEVRPGGGSAVNPTPLVTSLCR